LGHVAAYCRVNTDDQSCERQERDLRAFAKRADHHIVSKLDKQARQYDSSSAAPRPRI